MTTIHDRVRARVNYLAPIVILQVAFCFSLFFNIPMVRQIIGFLYLTIVPGYVIIRLLAREFETLELVLFSIGLSVAFIILIGLFANELYPIAGISRPLSMMSLAVTINGFVLLAALLGTFRGARREPVSFASLKPSTLNLVQIGLPITSALGAVWASITCSNIILLLFVIATAVTFLSTIVTRNQFKMSYALTIFVIAMALVFHATLVSGRLYGTDIHDECYISRLTQQEGFWNSSATYSISFFGREQSMLSITILPTAYSNLLGMDLIWIFKIIFPLIFIFVPLASYRMWNTNFSRKVAFVSALLLISEMTFYTEMLGVARQMVGELFLMLLLIVVLSDKLDLTISNILFAVFGLALVVSHYALALIFLTVIVALWVYGFVSKKPKTRFGLAQILTFFGMMFLWYIYTSASASFETIVSFVGNLGSSLTDFLDPTSRGATVMQGVGLAPVASLWQTLSRLFAYGIQFFIVIGFLFLLLRWRKMRLDWRCFIVSLMGIVLLAMAIALPSFAYGLNMTRLYHIVLLLIAPLFALGCEASLEYLGKRRIPLATSLLVVSLLVPYFLFQTGFVYEVTGNQSYSVPLSRYRMDELFLVRTFGYVEEKSVFGTSWVSKYVNTGTTAIYADALSSSFEFESYGAIYKGDVLELTNATSMPPKAVIYMSPLNVINGQVAGRFYLWNTTELSSAIEDAGMIYTNAETEVYFSTG